MKHILHIGKREPTAIKLYSTLKMKGHLVNQALTMKDALNIASNNDPDVLIIEAAACEDNLRTAEVILNPHMSHSSYIFYKSLTEDYIDRHIPSDQSGNGYSLYLHPVQIKDLVHEIERW